MFNFVIRRLLQAIPTILLASVLIFGISAMAPGDFLTPARLNPNISPEQIVALEKNFGLDKPVWQQYFLWMSNIFKGDFGMSFMYQQPALEIIIPRIQNSLYLAVIMIISFFALSISIGVYGALNQNSLGDKISGAFVYILLGFPSFFIALLVMFVILKVNQATGWSIPIGGMTSTDHDSLSAVGKFFDIMKHALIPGLLAGTIDIGGQSRYIRGLMIEQLQSDYVRTAKAKGLSESIVIWKHTFRNAVLPLVAGLGGLLPAMIGGIGFIEVVFAYPGITPMMLAALKASDLYVVTGFTLIIALLLIIGNIIADFLQSAVDPRVRLE